MVSPPSQWSQGGFFCSGSITVIPQSQWSLFGKVPNAFGVSSNSNQSAFEKTISNEAIRQFLLDKFEKLQPEAENYWDSLFTLNAYKRHGIVPINVPTYPILIWATENPVSFEWRLEQAVTSQVPWPFENVCAIPSRHKFLDRGFSNTNSIIIPFQPMTRRPILLDSDEPLISWYPGFVVENVYIEAIP